MKDGFSKLSKEEKIKWVNETFFNSDFESLELIKKYWNEDKSFQKLHDEFAENTLTNFYLPLGVAPNFIIDNKNYTIPMVTEEGIFTAPLTSSRYSLNCIS